jgi:isopentenyl-diphosphate delta-isomerase
MAFMGKILYKAACDETWGEHEVDYLFVAEAEPELVMPVAPNPNEVDSVRWVCIEEMRSMVRAAVNGELRMSPWCLAVSQRFLFDWWEALLEKRALVPLDVMSAAFAVHKVDC